MKVFSTADVMIVYMETQTCYFVDNVVVKAAEAEIFVKLSGTGSNLMK